ncbi:MAG: hypothetical protein KAI47_04670 [Deltaproteobacteria bacterium]|nr:hypothetical protein [Deltaproteobacteria bacterium]
MRAFAFGLFGLCGLWAPLACSFDGSGVGTNAGRDLHLIEGPADARAPDTTKGDAPVPDVHDIVDTHADISTKPDLGIPKDLPGSKDHVNLKLDLGPPPQGLICTNGPNKITADKVPTAGATLKLTVSSNSATWIMAGVSADQHASPAKNSFTWIGGVTSSVCINEWCTWVFPTVHVPNTPGPYTFGFMADAAGDKPNNGHIVFTCVP